MRHLEGDDQRILDVLAIHGEATINQHDIVIHTGTIVPILQADDERGVATARASRHNTVATDHSIVFQFGNLLHLLLHFLDNLLCLMQGATFRGTHLGEEHALILLRNKARRQAAHEEYQQYCCESE